ncbi:hypothetical protein [Bradyrhizobium sp. 1(2017)]|uniref:hypothetical protein n=1 Tax=Bradyrhizobium sp. 1(2017) TaxID=1404888 RepID=UPI00140F2D3E|nr:hypothetical protein [Bradyrhizobium sp. 1(2017)]QIO35748.1 hypothetical protein HAP40_30025 [Bradyrhizobium sp. 1(2017)]
MQAFSCAHDVALLQERFELLASQMAELEELRMRVLIAEQTMESTGAESMAERLTTVGRERQGASVGDIGRWH